MHRRQPRDVCGLHRARASRLRARSRAPSHHRQVQHASGTSGGQTLAQGSSTLQDMQAPRIRNSVKTYMLALRSDVEMLSAEPCSEATHRHGSSAGRTALSHTEPGGVAAGLATSTGGGAAVARTGARAGGAAGTGAAAGAAMAATAAGAAGARLTAGARATLASASGLGLVASAAGVCIAGPANASCRPAGAGRGSTVRGSSGGSSLATAAVGAAAAAGMLLAEVAGGVMAPAGGAGAPLASMPSAGLRRRTAAAYVCISARPWTDSSDERAGQVTKKVHAHI
jgi:hypothetical protein